MKNKISRILFCLFTVGFAICLVKVGTGIWGYHEADMVHGSVLETVEASVELYEAQATLDITVTEDIKAEIEVEQEVQMLAKYRLLYAENPELVGWVAIDETVLNYPVMQSPDVPNKYIYTDFYGNYSNSGNPFASAYSSIYPSGDNIVLYGHHMLGGSMFTEILNYWSSDYWQEHKIITFNTLYEEREYEVAYTFYEDVTLDNGHFKFYEFHNADVEAEFDDFIANCSARQCFDTGIVPLYGDELITLVTCSDHSENGRFVVVARRISE